MPVPPSGPSCCDDEEFGHIGTRQAALQSDLEAALRYGEGRPESFGGLWWEGARLQVGFTVLTPHTAAVLDLVEHPADVDVVLVPWTAQEVAAVRADVERRLERSPERWQSTSHDHRGVVVGLRADGTALAAELLEQFGDLLEVRLGGRRYPPQADDGQWVAPPGPVPTAHRPDLELRAVCDSQHVVTGHGFAGQLVVRNTSTVPVTLVTEQPLLASVLSADGRLAGGFTGFLAGTGLVLELAAGDSTSIGFLGGTAGGPAHSTAPGTYGLVVVLPLYEPESEQMPRTQLVSPPVPLLVVRR